MEELYNKLTTSIIDIMTNPCNQNCENCPLNRKMTSEFYNGKTFCDVVIDINDSLRR